MSVAPESWKEASIQTIKLAHTIIERSDRATQDAQRTDPLPLLRDACVKESNDRIHAYARSTRDVVLKLRQHLLAVNEEMKSLNRGKEALERAIEHKRKDLALNVESVETRNHRPSREKDYVDEADKLLSAEFAHLLSLKRALESQLRKVQQQLQVLSSCRGRLAALIQERSRVTELICHSMTSAPHRIDAPAIAQRSRKLGHTKSHSAPVPLLMTGQTFSPEPCGALTPEALEVMNLASSAIEKARAIRKELYAAHDHTQRLQAAAHSSVNRGFIQKLAQTVTLTQHLQINTGETHLALNRASRYHDSQEKAQGYVLGPVSYADIATRERLDRPLVRVFQRHPGTDLPDAAHLIAANNAYLDSMTQTRRNITLLKLAKKHLNADTRDKKVAAEIDSNVVRLRRRKANHRWVLGGHGTGKPTSIKS